MAVNQNAGRERQKYLQDPFSLTKHEASKLLVAITESFEDITTMYEHLCKNSTLLSLSNVQLEEF